MLVKSWGSDLLHMGQSQGSICPVTILNHTQLQAHIHTLTYWEEKIWLRVMRVTSTFGLDFSIASLVVIVSRISTTLFYRNILSLKSLQTFSKNPPKHRKHSALCLFYKYLKWICVKSQCCSSVPEVTKLNITNTTNEDYTNMKLYTLYKISHDLFFDMHR